jgi:hypothetical protein
VTLKNGQKLEVRSERQNFLRIRGMSEFGPVVVEHPDPAVIPLRLSTRRPDREDDLTIRFIEFK